MNIPTPVADPTASMVSPAGIEAPLAVTSVPSPVPVVVAPVSIPQLTPPLEVSSTPVVTPLSTEPLVVVADTSDPVMVQTVDSVAGPPLDDPDFAEEVDMEDDDDDDEAGQGGTQTQTPTPKSSTTSSSSKKKKSSAQVTVTMATAAAAAQSGLQGMQGENTGRWTAEEHRLFLQGLELHGKGWKKIASLIKSRTVVQIRTHAQKYFQKLAKAKQNGEEGEILMEGRGGTTAVPSVTTSAAQTNKRRKQTSGTKRKAIQSVVASAQRQGKKQATAQPEGSGGVVTSVAPALSPYILPPTQVPNPVDTTLTGGQQIPSITTANGTISGAALEDSLFRYLTPAPVSPSEPQLHEIARQAGANPITLPTDQPHVVPAGGEISPTGVADYTMYPSWTDAKDTPSWYAKGSDVDALLDVADNLDWLEDTGDLNETYEAAAAAASAVDSTPLTSEYGVSYHDVEPNKINHGPVGSAAALAHYANTSSMSMNTLPRIDSGAEVVVPPLPSLFDGTADTGETPDEPGRKLILHNLKFVSTLDDHLQVFDTPIDEHDFVSTILDDDNVGESSATLAALSCS